MSVYGMGITVDIPPKTKAQLFARVDKIQKTASKGVAGVFVLAGAIFVAVPLGFALRRKLK